MKFRGLLLKESLKDNSVMKEIEITKTEIWNIDNAADYQPKIWTAVYFQGDEDKIDEMVVRLSQSLKPKWYINR